MMIRLECNTWEELIELMGSILSNETAKNNGNLQKPAETDTKPVETVPAAVAPAPAAVTPAPAPAAVAPAKTVTRKDVQAKAISLMDAGKQAQLQSLLIKYGVPALPSVPDDKLADFMADLEAM